MTAKIKLWTLAQLDASMRATFGNPALSPTGFRWCDVQLVQGYLPKTRGAQAYGGGTSTVITRRVSTIPFIEQLGLNPLERVRFQFDVLDLDPDICEQSASTLIAWLGTINLVSGAQFGSPVSVPNQFPNNLSNRRSGLYPQPGAVVYTESVDVMVYNNTAN